jgi:hypothetical protein
LNIHLGGKASASSSVLIEVKKSIIGGKRIIPNTITVKTTKIIFLILPLINPISHPPAA